MTVLKTYEISDPSGVGSKESRGVSAWVEPQQPGLFSEFCLMSLDAGREKEEEPFVDLWLRIAARYTTEPKQPNLFSETYLRIFDALKGVLGAKERLHAHIQYLRSDQGRMNEASEEVCAETRDRRQAYGGKYSL